MSTLIISNHEDYLKYLFVEYHHSSIKTIYQWQLQFRLKSWKIKKFTACKQNLLTCVQQELPNYSKFLFDT